MSFVNKEVRLIKLDNLLVKEDYLDKRWEEATGELVDEIIFLSKHVASSNRPALTVHPIGILLNIRFIVVMFATLCVALMDLKGKQT